MKKLYVFTIISVFLILELVGTVLAKDDDNWGAIKGTYDMIATGSCLHSPSGFNGSGTLSDPYKPAGDSYAAPTLARATWTFDGRGTATFAGENFATIFPGGAPLGAQERENDFGPSYFDYTADGQGWIMGTIRGAGLVLQGRISKDHKIITLSSANQKQFGGTAICNSARILFKVSD